MRVVATLRHVVVAGLFLPGGDGGGRPVPSRGPTFAVDPSAIQIVRGRHFLELRNQQLIDVGSKRARDVAVRLAVGPDAGPVGMVLDGDRVPNARVMDEQSHAALASRLAPDRQRILDDPRRGPADLGRIAGVAGVTFAVVLDVVGVDAFQQRRDVLLGDVSPQGRIAFLRVKIEVQPKEGVFSRQRTFYIRPGRRLAVLLGEGRRRSNACQHGHQRETRDQAGQRNAHDDVPST